MSKSPISYVKATALDRDEIQAAERSGLLVPWRRDANGELWYRRLVEIHGVPADPGRTEGDADGG